MPFQAAENFIVRAPEADPPALSSHPASSVPDFAGFLPPVSNITFTPNQFFDVCLPHCSRSAVRVVAYFLRRTLGWCDQYGRPQEEQIEISFRELAAKAGVSRDRLRAALDEAIAGHFLECVREGRPNRAHEAGQSALYRLCWHDSAGYQKDPAAFRGFFEREGNRTDIPNQFFDHIVPNEPLSVIKVVGSIIRSSIGFAARRGARRQWASLSYTQIQNFTRLASRKELSTALRTALARRYIVRLEAGRFTHEKAEQRSAVYALRWADGWSGNPDGQKSQPEEAGPDRSEIHTSHGPIPSPEERSGITTSIKTKLTNETEKQLQVEAAAASPALEILLKEGFNKETARELAETIAPEVIRQQIEWLPHRSPARSRLGMLRRAMEGNWPPPAGLRTSEVPLEANHSRELVRHFYAGFHANEGEPLAEPTSSECALAVPLTQRLLQAGAKPEALPHWGRELGRMAREQRNPIPSFQVALRQVGDSLCAAAEETLRRRRSIDREVAKVEHRNQAMPRYLEFLRGLERKIRTEQPDEYARFEAKRAAERARLQRDEFAWRSKILDEFDGATHRLSMLQKFFQLPGFWQWDASENPYPFNPQT
jgi:hypothetical protein